MSDELSGFAAIVSTWGRTFRAIIVLVALLVGLYAIGYNIVTAVNPHGLRLTTNGGTAIEVGECGYLYSFLVHPRGWQKTNILLHAGDVITVSASGSINIAMGRLNESLEKLYSIKNERQRNNLSRDVNELTDDQKKACITTYPWNGPDGIHPEDIMDASTIKSMNDSAKHRVIEKAKAGQLIVAISMDNEPKSFDLNKLQYFKYENDNQKFTVKTDGYLWTAVNDLWFKDDLYANRLAWDDNIGIFEVKIRIDRKK